MHSIILTEPVQHFYSRDVRLSSDLHFCNLGENNLGSADTERGNKCIFQHSKYYDWLLKDSAPFIFFLRRVMKEIGICVRCI